MTRTLIETFLKLRLELELMCTFESALIIVLKFWKKYRLSKILHKTQSLFEVELFPTILESLQNLIVMAQQLIKSQTIRSRIGFFPF